MVKVRVCQKVVGQVLLILFQLAMAVQGRDG